jgi:hypothetical protein
MGLFYGKTFRKGQIVHKTARLTKPGVSSTMPDSCPQNIEKYRLLSALKKRIPRNKPSKIPAFLQVRLPVCCVCRNTAVRRIIFFCCLEATVAGLFALPILKHGTPWPPMILLRSSNFASDVIKQLLKVSAPQTIQRAIPITTCGNAANLPIVGGDFTSYYECT